MSEAIVHGVLLVVKKNTQNDTEFSNLALSNAGNCAVSLNKPFSFKAVTSDNPSSMVSSFAQGGFVTLNQNDIHKAGSHTVYYDGMLASFFISLHEI